MTTPLLIFGISEYASMMHYYLLHDSVYKPAAFVVDDAYVKEKEFCGIPVYGFSEALKSHPPETCRMFIGIGYTNANKLREEKLVQAKRHGYRPITYISSRANVPKNLEIGENSVIFDGVSIQPYARIGNGVIVISNSVIGAYAKVGDFVFIGTNSYVSGGSEIGEKTTIGANVVTGNGIRIGRQAMIGGNCLIAHNIGDYEVYTAEHAKKRKCDSRRIKTFL